jgi:hypothetical protein
MTDGPLKLKDDDFWGDFTRTKPDVIAKVSDEDFRGVIIDAPDLVPLRDRATAPVVGYFVRTLRDDLAIDQATQMIAAATNLGTNHTTVGLALAPQKHPTPIARPTADPGEGLTLNAIESDLRDALRLPWEPAKYRVAFLCREWVSNAVTTEFGRPPADFKDPEVEKFLAAQRKSAPVPPPEKVSPARPADAAPGGLPDFAKRDDSPPVPAQPGIEFAVDRVVVAKADAACVLRASYRLPVLPREKATPRGEAKEPPDVGDPKATAVLPVTLVLTASDAPGPWTFRLFVPTYDPIPPGADPAVATGHFALDLFRLENFPTTPMTYFVTAVSGPVVSGPKAIGLVTEDMLGR